SELKRELKKNIREDVSPLVRFKSTLDSQVESGLAEIHMIAQQEVHNIEATLALLDQKSLAAAALALSKAHAIYTVGVGISSHAAGIAALAFQHIGLKASALQHTGLNISEQLIALRKGELLLAFSLPPYSTQTIDAAILAKKRHASVIGITNRTIAPISEHCDIVLVAKTESGVPSNSLTAPLVLIYGLTSIIAAQSRPRSLDALETTIKLRKQNLDSR
ncbi:MAG: MurR/RpiR family transcriptional regulator, partial [Ignavibacteriales bacterium]|nr:MurR/RpiR family transcriptional regulator [Ignavibacteriales bacterium]